MVGVDDERRCQITLHVDYVLVSVTHTQQG